MTFSEELYEKMYLIRYFEEAILDLFDKGNLSGTTHAYIGQEANAVGIIDHLVEKDIIYSSHRCHGHYLSKTRDVFGLASELMGKETGVVGGRGGSQHICGENFYTNGVQGGIVPVCSGMALAEKFKDNNTVSTVFIGDGTLGEGVIYESFNMAKLWDVPLLVVLENNRYAQSTPVEENLSGDMATRFEAFNIPVREIESFDVEEIHDASKSLVDKVRRGGGPVALIIHTYRFCSHSKSPDGRDEEEVEKWRSQNDPLEIQRSRVGTESANGIEEVVQHEVDKEIKRAEQQTSPALV